VPKVLRHKWTITSVNFEGRRATSKILCSRCRSSAMIPGRRQKDAYLPPTKEEERHLWVQTDIDSDCNVVRVRQIMDV
jgi:hypothetical protein